MSIFQKLSTLGAAALAACVFSLIGQAAHAQGVSYAQAQGRYEAPPGSYRQTCQNIRVEGAILRAACTNRAGARVAASIDLSVCRDRELDNENGVLRCGRLYTPAPRQPPTGSYQDTCRNPVMRGSILTAQCRNFSGALVNASLDVNTCGEREIYNDNGVLRCAAAPQSQLPGGTWRNSCRDPQLRDNVLTARCTRPGAAAVVSSLDLSTCRTREAVNDNGYLRCTLPGQQGQVPNGSYLATCREAAVRGNMLTARCTRQGGVALYSTLDLTTCRNRDIVNSNGYLVCGGLLSDRVPQGSYQASCRDATVRGNVLSARCTARNGSTVLSTLNLNDCRNRDIVNVNGYLQCGGAPGAQLPPGSYQATCRDAVVRGDILSARCSFGNRPPVVSSIDLRQCRNRDIENVNGSLRCGDFLPGPGRGGGRGQRDDFEAVLYTGTNYRGQQILITDPVPSLAAQSGFNDTVRSIRVLRGSVEICADPNYGRCTTLEESTPDLGAIGMDRVISSIRSADDGFPGRGRGRGFDD